MKSFLHLLLISVILLTAGIGAHECRAQGYSADEYKSDIRAALGAEDYSKAIEICENALKEYPNEADFFYYKGFAFAESNQFDKAMEAYKKGISIHVDRSIGVDPENAEAFKHYKNAQANKKENPNFAIEEYLISQNLEPNNPAGFYGAAATYLNNKDDPEKAIKYVKKVFGIKPDYILAFHVLGNAYQKQEEWKKASFYFNIALLIDPNYRFKDSVLNRISECSKHLK